MTEGRRCAKNRWVASGDDFIGAAWFWPTHEPANSTAVVIVPGIVHEERTMNGGLVALAESLADAGLPTLLIDLHGCSQSAGSLENADIGVRWRTNIRAAVSHARSTGAARVIVVGVRLGFLLAAEALADEPLAALVAWAPIVNGKQYVRELKVLQRTNDTERSTAGAIAIGGFSIPAPVLAYISGLDLSKVDPQHASFVMLRDTIEALNAPWLAHLGECGSCVQEQVSTQIHPWLFGAVDQPELPHEDIHAVTRWCRVWHDQQATAGEPAPTKPKPQPAINFAHRGHFIRETFIEIGSSGLTGVLSEPAKRSGDHAARLFMSTVGPGRTFADFARDEASRGMTSLRFDFKGFGTSGRGDAVQGGELYTDGGRRDVQAAIAHLREVGHTQIYGVGFCAGAWSMIHSDVAPELRAVVAINVALYRQPGKERPSFLKLARRRLPRLSPALARNPLFRGVAARVRRPANKRCEPIEWLLRLCRADVRVLLAYAECDPGLDYLNGQTDAEVRERLHQQLTLQVYPGLGHLAEGPSARTQMFQDITDFFAGLDREAPSLREPRSDYVNAG